MEVHIKSARLTQYYRCSYIPVLLDAAESDSRFWLKILGARSVGLVDELARAEGDLPA